jgi:hypothetical protein
MHSKISEFIAEQCLSLKIFCSDIYSVGFECMLNFFHKGCTARLSSKRQDMHYLLCISPLMDAHYGLWLSQLQCPIPVFGGNIKPAMSEV